jgi:L-alanine-DL-glutamate epimerase-like enolase superfamily enzyme
LSHAAVKAPRFQVLGIDLFERDVRLRMPFRFGIVTLTAAPQAFARVRIQLEDGRVSEGASAELLAPKWFDKNPALSNEDNFQQLRIALHLARDAYLRTELQTAFERFEAEHLPHIERAATLGLNTLTANFGPALIDRALIDALCRAEHVSFYQAMQRNLGGLRPTSLAPDLEGFDFDALMVSLTPATRIQARHTVGLVDLITEHGRTPNNPPVGDGLPETLEAVVARYGHRWFKLKVGGDQAADLQRLIAIAGVLDQMPYPYRASLDGNEQYDDVESIAALWSAMRSEKRLQRLVSSVVFIEQPIKRHNALSRDIRALARQVPVIIDESDDSLDAFVRARHLGYSGVSSKTCKGIWRSFLNRARCQHWNQRTGQPGTYFMSAEDLTIQAGLALQQDLALVNILGIDHVERNGHHYVNGMADLPPAEQARFLSAHPDLYEHSHGATRLAINAGNLTIASLDCEGFASAAMPEWSAMRPMPR